MADKVWRANKPNPAYPRPDPMNPYLDPNGVPTTSAGQYVNPPDPNAQAITPKTVLGGDTSKGVEPAVPPYTPPTNPSGAAARAAGMTSGNVQPRTAAPAAPVDQGPQRPGVGTPGYDIWAINDILAGPDYSGPYNGWQILGSTPVQTVKQVKNPDYDPDLQQGNEYNDVPQNEFIINIRNGQDIKTIKLAKMHPGPNGQPVAGDPGPGLPYSYQLTDIIDQQKADPTKLGHANPMQIGTKLWGTNNATGVFEIVPGAPDIPKGWTNVTTGKTTDGSGGTTWYGIDPSDNTMKQVTGAPVIPKEAEGWGSPTEMTEPDGSKVWYGTDPKTKQWGPIPGLPKTGPKPTGPGSITQAGTTFVQKPDGSYEPARGVPDPNPPKGQTQLILGPDGFIYRQVSRGNGQGFDPDDSFSPVPYSDAAKQARANAGALHKAGEPGTKVIGGRVYHVTYRGGSDDAYDVDTSQPATLMPGTEETTSIATSTDQPFIAQRTAGKAEPTWVENRNYLPTDPAQRSAQLSQQAAAKLDEYKAKVASGTLTGDQAQAEYDKWWDASIEPAKAEIRQAQQKVQLDQQLKVNAEARAQAEQQRAIYSTAAEQGQKAAENVRMMLPNAVGPNFGNAMNQLSKAWATGGSTEGIDWGSALTYQAPDLNALAQQVTNQALAHISPMASHGMNAATGANTTNFGPQLPSQLENYDYTQGLQKNRYQVPGTTTTVAPDGTVRVTQGGNTNPVEPVAQPQAPTINPANVSAPNIVPGQNYGAAQAYTGGVDPWRAIVQPAIPNYRLT